MQDGQSGGLVLSRLNEALERMCARLEERAEKGFEVDEDEGVRPKRSLFGWLSGS